MIGNLRGWSQGSLETFPFMLGFWFGFGIVAAVRLKHFTHAEVFAYIYIYVSVGESLYTIFVWSVCVFGGCPRRT